MTTTIALSGDAIINRRISVCDDDRFHELVEQFRDADVGFTHLETVIHDYDGPEVYPAAEAGGTWMRSPEHVAEELAWAGFDAVSHASNHALDYGYGGLRETWAALDGAGVACAGTGENLGEARAPTYFETGSGRAALVSMTSSFTRWSRAGQARSDVKGRPGVNPLRYHYEVDAETMETIEDLEASFGNWVTRVGDGTLVNEPGTHNTMDRYVEGDVDGVEMALDGDDAEGNLRSIADAATRADVTIAHLHTHEFDPDGDATDPPDCMEAFARDCADAGADVVILQGTHAPLRGIEVHAGTPIFHDPGDFFFMSDTVTRLPAEFYYRHEHDLDAHPLDATPAEGFAARGLVYPWGEPSSAAEDGSTFGKDENLLSPPGGFFVGPGCIVPVCEFDDDMALDRIEVHPAVWFEEPESLAGAPRAAQGETARDILEYLRDLSAPYGTSMSIEDGVGVIEA